MPIQRACCSSLLLLLLRRRRSAGLAQLRMAGQLHGGAVLHAWRLGVAALGWLLAAPPWARAGERMHEGLEALAWKGGLVLHGLLCRLHGDTIRVAAGRRGTPKRSLALNAALRRMLRLSAGGPAWTTRAARGPSLSLIRASAQSI